MLPLWTPPLSDRCLHVATTFAGESIPTSHGCTSILLLSFIQVSQCMYWDFKEEKGGRKRKVRGIELGKMNIQCEEIWIERGSIYSFSSVSSNTHDTNTLMENSLSP